MLRARCRLRGIVAGAESSKPRSSAQYMRCFAGASKTQPRPRAGSLYWIVLVLIICTLAFWLVPRSDANDTPGWVPAPAQPADYTFLDLELSLRARKVLREDAALNAPNLGVTVHSRVATLWGDVPSPELAQLAESRLRQVLGLTSIRNELHVKPGTDQAKNSSPLASLQRRPFLAEPVVPEPVRVDEFLARRPSGHGLAPGQEMLWRPRKPASQPAISPLLGPFVPSVGDRRTTDADGPSSPPTWRPKGGLGMELQQPGASSAEAATVIPPLRLPAAPSAGQASVDLAREVEALRRKDERFGRVRPEVKGGVIYLRGTVSRWEHIYELARSLSLLPGVERIILEDVQIVSRP